MRIVIKVGSNVLTRVDGKLDVTMMSSIVDQLAWLHASGNEVVLVSSGALACGRGEMRVDHKLDSVEQRQLYSALGQVKLINRYYDLFRDYGIHVGQVLTMKESFATRREYLNQRACMEVMLANGVVPIVNENDTISVTELMFTDNDELSGLIATMMNADVLVILSNIDGIYDGSPSSPNSRVIATVAPDTSLDGCIRQEKSGFGRGGMVTKCGIARRVAAEGIRVIIANGRRKNIIKDLIERPKSVVHTEFTPSPDAAPAMKKWIANSASFSKGRVYVNAKAAEALKGERAVSLLMVGVTSVEGDFEEGDIVTVVDNKGTSIGMGRSGYGYTDALRLIGEHDVKPIIHYDYLYMY